MAFRFTVDDVDVLYALIVLADGTVELARLRPGSELFLDGPPGKAAAATLARRFEEWDPDQGQVRTIRPGDPGWDDYMAMVNRPDAGDGGGSRNRTGPA